MHYLPQLVGQRCSRCEKVISSITEGAFCSSCRNPVHNKCRPRAGAIVPADSCSSCGADPKSDAAREVQAEVEQKIAKGAPTLQCRVCGSTRGFKPYGREMEASPPGGLIFLGCLTIPVLLLLGLVAFILALGRIVDKGAYECLSCGHVFQPTRRTTVLGWIILLALAAAAILVVAVVWGEIYWLPLNQ